MTKQKRTHKTAKVLLSLAVAGALVGSVFAGCSAGKSDKGNKNATAGVTGSITVVSREEGSGTRGAFIELLGIEEKDANGNKIDKTTTAAEITNSTAVMLTTVAGNSAAIGYVSMGSLNDSVKAVKVDGVEATPENVSNSSYSISRPFNIVTKTDGISDAAQDFINFIMSDDGQAVVEDADYIPVSSGTYEAADVSGKVTVAGSSSVTPVMTKLKEAYEKINTNVTVDVQQSDSTTGVTSAVQGICDIGMASRELKDSETSQGVEATVIAMDGIAVIVNKENTIEDLTLDQIRQIYVGEVTSWDELNK